MTQGLDVLSLDIATVTGWARGRVGDEAPTCGSVKFGKANASQLAIVGRGLEWIIGVLKPPLPDVIAIEGLLPPAVIRGRSNLDHDLLAKLHGVVMGTAFLRGVYRVNHYPVMSIRAHFIDLSTCGKGESKMMVQRKCKSLGWLEAADDDAADACAVWSYQAALIDPEQSIRISPLFHRLHRGEAIA